MSKKIFKMLDLITTAHLYIILMLLKSDSCDKILTFANYGCGPQISAPLRAYSCNFGFK